MSAPGPSSELAARRRLPGLLPAALATRLPARLPARRSGRRPGERGGERGGERPTGPSSVRPSRVRRAVGHHQEENP